MILRAPGMKKTTIRQGAAKILGRGQFVEGLANGQSSLILKRMLDFK